MKPLAANTLLQNRYLIVHLIGKGGMGDVYLAIDQRLGSAVALKRTFFSGDEVFADAFEREARTLARLRNNALPKVSDHFIEDETQYLIMEHIAGDDLAKRLEVSEKPFPVAWVLFWADQLLDALGYLHSQEPPVLHRDIKPQNLKLTDENSVVLLDFGLSKNTVGETRSATTGSVVGYTPHFAPMEQIRGTGTDARSDIYSLSATLYQLLTNVVPPDVLTRADALLGGKPDPIEALNEINGEVSREVSDVILKGMAVSQEQRFSGARQMQKALRDVFAQNQNTNSKQNESFAVQTHNSISGISQPQLKTNVSIGSTPEGKSLKNFAPDNFDKPQEPFSQTPVQSPPKKNSNGRFLKIIGLSVPFALAIIAGIGWFMLYNSGSATKENPTPTPVVIISPTPEATPDSNINTLENANVSDEVSITNENADVGNQTSENKAPNLTNKNARVIQPTTAKSAPKPSQLTKTATKATPKPTPLSKATPLPRILP